MSTQKFSPIGPAVWLYATYIWMSCFITYYFIIILIKIVKLAKCGCETIHFWFLSLSHIISNINEQFCTFFRIRDFPTFLGNLNMFGNAFQFRQTIGFLATFIVCISKLNILQITKINIRLGKFWPDRFSRFNVC